MFLFKKKKVFEIEKKKKEKRNNTKRSYTLTKGTDEEMEQTISILSSQIKEAEMELDRLN